MSSDLISAYRFHKAAIIAANERRHRPRVSTDGAASTIALAKARLDAAAGKSRYTTRIHSSRIGADTMPGKLDSVFFESAESGGFREVGFYDEIYSYARHKGYYSDTHQDAVLRGCVLQLPAKGRAVRFVAAYQESESGGYIVDLTTIYSELAGDSSYDTAKEMQSALDAANAGDSMAERAAEDAREYDTAWQAGSLYASEGETISAARKEALEILAERRKVKGIEAPALCAAIRSQIESLLADISEAREKREKLAAGDYQSGDFSLIFWEGNPDLKAAFNDGAGQTVLT